ncbi:MAG: hypothetical protein KGM47_05065, partial [Acidobacteriota bacterium]|nr:hypothetical protein [Acidobacteriota bacterium]
FGELGNEAIVLGVGAIALERHFEIPVLKPPRFMIESVARPLRRKPRAESPGLADSQFSSIDA